MQGGGIEYNFEVVSRACCALTSHCLVAKLPAAIQ